MPKVFISTSTFSQYDQRPLEALRSAGISVELNPYGRTLKPQEIISHVAKNDFLIAGTEKLDKKTLAELKGLKIISRCGTGMDNIDLAAAKELGIKVYNTPDVVTDAVAELTVAFILNLLRKISSMDHQVKNNVWEKKMGFLLRGKKVGIIGFGRIGQRVAELLAPFNVEIGYYDVVTKKTAIPSASMTKKELLKWADIVTVHSSGAEGNSEIISAQDFNDIKKGSWFVNVSRGENINETALVDALSRGDIAGAALDVFGKEPYQGPLQNFDNVILTPHIGSYAKESRIQMEMEAVENLIKGIGKNGG